MAIKSLEVLAGEMGVLTAEPSGEAEATKQLRPQNRQIPSKLWNPIKDDLTQFIRDEIAVARTERGAFINKLAHYELVYDAPMPTEPKRHPFIGASNLTLPVIKEAVNTLVAQLIQSTLTSRPRWVLKDLAAEWEPFIDELQRFMDIAGDRDLHIGENAIPWIIEAAMLGTSILEVGWEVDVREQYRVTADGQNVYPHDQIFHDGPMTYPMNLADFFIRFGESHPDAIQRAQWVSKILRFNEVELNERSYSGKFPNIGPVLLQIPREPDVTVQVKEESEKTRPIRRTQHEIHEVWVRWAIKKGKRYSDLRVYYHEDSQTIVGAEFHPYHHGRRPFHRMIYFPRVGRFYGQGLCEMLEQIQEATSARFNQRSDNITMSSLKMFLKRKGVKGLMPGDPLYQGKIITVMDVHNDVRELQMGEIYPSTVQEELMLRDYGERLSGLNEAVIGSASPVSRTTASAQMMLLQEQAKRIDLTVRSIRGGLNGVGQDAMMLYMQYGTNGKAIAWMGEQGKIVEAIFSLPARIIELGLALRVQVPTSTQNLQVKRENSLAMYNLLVQMYEKMIPLAQALAPEQLPSVILAMVRSSQKFLGDVLETFDTTDPEGALAGLAVLERVLPAAEDLGGLERHARSVESAEIAASLDGLEDLLRSAESAGRRTDGVPSLSSQPERVPPAAGSPSGLGEDIFFGGDANGSGGG